MPEPYVPRIRLLADNSAELDVTLDGSSAGKSVEISGYVAQGGKVFPFYSLQPVPAADPASKTSSLTVTVPPMKELTLGQDVTVITRVTEVLIWPTVLGYTKAAASGIKGLWQVKTSDSAASVVGQDSSASNVYGGSATPVTAVTSTSECPPPGSDSPLVITMGSMRVTIETAGQ